MTEAEQSGKLALLALVSRQKREAAARVERLTVEQGEIAAELKTAGVPLHVQARFVGCARSQLSNAVAVWRETLR